MFAENDPHHAHANAALSAIYSHGGGGVLPVHGNAPGSRFVHTRLSDQLEAGEVPVGNGSVLANDHLALTGIVVLYEGDTVAGVQLPLGGVSSQGGGRGGGGGSGGSRQHVVDCAVGGVLAPVVTGGYPHGHNGAVTIVAQDGGQFNPAGRVRGRVVVDTGFTKLWRNWKIGATERWVTNATTWLLGVDARIALGQSDEVLRQPPFVNNAGGAGRGGGVPRALRHADVVYGPPDVLSDVIFVVDVSGSMKSQGEKMRKWALGQAHAFDALGVRSGLILFDDVPTTRTDPVPFEDFERCAGLPSRFGGTNYLPAVEAATVMLQSLHSRQSTHGARLRRVVIFQTDGGLLDVENIPRIQQECRRWREELHTTVVTVLVGNDLLAGDPKYTLLENMAHDPHMFIRFSDYAALRDATQQLLQLSTGAARPAQTGGTA